MGDASTVEARDCSVERRRILGMWSEFSSCSGDHCLTLGDGVVKQSPLALAGTDVFAAAGAGLGSAFGHADCFGDGVGVLAGIDFAFTSGAAWAARLSFGGTGAGFGSALGTACIFIAVILAAFAFASNSPTLWEGVEVGGAAAALGSGAVAFGGAAKGTGDLPRCLTKGAALGGADLALHGVGTDATSKGRLSAHDMALALESNSCTTLGFVGD